MRISLSPFVFSRQSQPSLHPEPPAPWKTLFFENDFSYKNSCCAPYLFGDDTGGPNRGAVYILFLNVDGTVKSSTTDYVAQLFFGFGLRPTFVSSAGITSQYDRSSSKSSAKRFFRDSGSKFGSSVRECLSCFRDGSIEGFENVEQNRVVFRWAPTMWWLTQDTLLGMGVLRLFGYCMRRNQMLAF